MLDITTHALAQDALNSLADGITLVDETGRIALLNPRAQTLLDPSPTQWNGAPIADLYTAIAKNSTVGEPLAKQFERHAAQAQEMPRLEFTLRAPREKMLEAKWFALQ